MQTPYRFIIFLFLILTLHDLQGQNIDHINQSMLRSLIGVQDLPIWEESYPGVKTMIQRMYSARPNGDQGLQKKSHNYTFTYQFDQEGRLLEERDSSLFELTKQYTYDQAGQLILLTKTDKDGGITHRTYQYNEKGQLVESMDTVEIYGALVPYRHTYQWDSGLFVGITTFEDGKKKSYSTIDYKLLDHQLKVSFEWCVDVNNKIPASKGYRLFDQQGILTDEYFNGFRSDRFKKQIVFLYNDRGWLRARGELGVGQMTETDREEAILKEEVMATGKTELITYPMIDQHGNWLVKVVSIRGGKSGWIYEREITYY